MKLTNNQNQKTNSINILNVISTRFTGFVKHWILTFPRRDYYFWASLSWFCVFFGRCIVENSGLSRKFACGSWLSGPSYRCFPYFYFCFYSFEISFAGRPGRCWCFVGCCRSLVFEDLAHWPQRLRRMTTKLNIGDDHAIFPEAI